MRAFFAFVATLVVLAALALYGSAFIVHQNEQALVLRFGNPKQVIQTPGLHWKVPLVDTVDFFDKRILDLDTSEQEVSASDQQRLKVDAYARYKITDPLKFYQNVRYEERVKDVVGPLIESEIRRVLGSATLQDVVKDKREMLMKQIKDQVNKDGKDYGLEVVDVRIKRANLPQESHQLIGFSLFVNFVRSGVHLRHFAAACAVGFVHDDAGVAAAQQLCHCFAQPPHHQSLRNQPDPAGAFTQRFRAFRRIFQIIFILKQNRQYSKICLASIKC